MSEILTFDTYEFEDDPYHVFIQFDPTDACLTVTKSATAVAAGEDIFICPALHIPSLGAIGIDIATIRKVIIDFETDDASIYTIAEKAFINCTNLEEIELPEQISFGLEAFNFQSNTKFKTVVYNGTIQTWCDRVTYYIDPEAEETEAQTLARLNSYLINNTSPLARAQTFYLKEVDAEENITLTEVSSLDLREISFEDNTIPAFAFAFFPNVTELILPTDLEVVSFGAFYGCPCLRTVELPRTTTFVDSYAFAKCSNLSKAFICKGAIQLDRDVFAQCSADLKIYIEGNKADFLQMSTENAWDAWWLDTSLMSAAEFYNRLIFRPYKYFGCTSQTLTCSGGLYWQQDFDNNISIVGFDADILYREPEFADNGALITLNSWEEFESKVSGAYSDIIEYLLVVKIPEQINSYNVTTIKSHAFTDCHKASIIEIPRYLSNIEDFAFYRCGNIKSYRVSKDNLRYSTVELTSAVSLIDNLTHSYLVDTNTNAIVRFCTGYPDSLVAIDLSSHNIIKAGAFESSLDLQTIVFKINYNIAPVANPTKNICFEEDAFYDCTKLKAVVLSKASGQNVTGVDKSVWYCWLQIFFANPQANPLYYAKHIYHDKISKDKKIWLTAKDNTTDTAYIEEELEIDVNIPNFAFYNCKNLAAIILENATETSLEIGKFAFTGCSYLNTLTLPNALLEIGESAFQDCCRLSTITYSGTFTTWCASSFENEFSNPLYYDINHTYTNITLPGDEKQVYQYQLRYKKKLDAGWFDYFEDEANGTWINTVTEVVPLAAQIPDCTFMNGSFSSFSGLFTSSNITSSDTALSFSTSSEIPGITIGAHAFENAKFLSDNSLSLVIGDNIHLGTAAFKGIAIPNIKITGENVRIGDYAFAETTLAASGALEITSANVILEDNCFYRANFAEVTTPARFLPQIDLSRCKKLTIILDDTYFTSTMFHSVPMLEQVTFKITSTSTNINLTQTLGVVDSDSFKYCPNLEKLEIVDNTVASGATGEYFTESNCIIHKYTKDDIDYNELVTGANFNYTNTAAENTLLSDIQAINLIIQEDAFAGRTFTSHETIGYSTNANCDIWRKAAAEKLFKLPDNTYSISKDIFKNTKLRYINTIDDTIIYDTES